MLNSSNKCNKTARAWFQLLAICVLFSTACNNTNTETEQVASAQTVPPTKLENRFDVVRAIHDEVMPERGRLIRLQRTIAGADLGEDVTAFAKIRLERADDMMMNWMYADIPFSTLVDSLDEASIYAYLATRESEIREVSDSMMTAIQYVESILAQ